MFKELSNLFFYRSCTALTFYLSITMTLKIQHSALLQYIPCSRNILVPPFCSSKLGSPADPVTKVLYLYQSISEDGRLYPTTTHTKLKNVMALLLYIGDNICATNRSTTFGRSTKLYLAGRHPIHWLIERL